MESHETRSFFSILRPPPPEEGEAPSSSRLRNMVTSKLNMGHVYISDLECPKVQGISSTISRGSPRFVS